MLDKANFIDVTGVHLAKVAQVAYNLSRPQGLGFLHYQPGEISLDQAKTLVKPSPFDGLVLYLDYVAGRAVKMAIYEEGGKLYMERRWFDHTVEDMRTLLKECGLDPKEADARGGE